MKQKIIYITLIIATLFLNSCNLQELLDEPPQNEIIITNVEDFELLMAPTRASHFRYTASEQALMTDIFYWKDTTYNYMLSIASSYEFQSQWAYMWDRELYRSGIAPIYWQRAYKAIYILNYMLERIDDAPGLPGSDDIRTRIKAEAQAQRAYHYFALVNNYGKHYNPATAESDIAVPMPLKANDEVLAPTSVAAIYEQILADAEAAVPYLNNMPSNFLNDYANTAPSKAAVLGFLSRVYLYMATDDSEQSQMYLQKAADAAKESMGIYFYLYDLNTEYYETNTIRNHKECIWYKTAYIPGGISADNYYPERAPTLTNDFIGSFESNDLRKNSGVHRYVQLSDNSFSLNQTRKWGIYTSEIILNRAEALARLGQLQESLDLVNQMRDARYEKSAPHFQTTDQNELINYITAERRREFGNDETRWWDMKRLVVLGEYDKVLVRTDPKGRTVTLNPTLDETKYVLDIPEYIINFNPDWVKK